MGNNFFVGLDIDYKYIPLRIDDFSLKGHFLNIGWQAETRTDVPVRVDLSFPSARANVGGIDLGLNLGFHF